jgi:hypothetical protein
MLRDSIFSRCRRVPLWCGSTASRQILLCVYLAILLLSAALLIARAYLTPNNTAVGTVLALQIVYKVLSVGFVTNPINPVKW